MTTPKQPPIPSVPKASPPVPSVPKAQPPIPSVPMLARGKPHPVDAPAQDAPSGDSPSADTTPMKFELAMTQDEIYSDSFKIGKGPELPPTPPPAPEPAPSLSIEPVPDGPLPGPSGPPGLLVARRRKSASQRLIAHPVIWPSVGAAASLLVGFLAALWISGSLLASGVKPLVTERAILLKTPVEQRDAPRIKNLDASIADARSSVAWKTGGLWTLVFAAGLFTWSRVFRD